MASDNQSDAAPIAIIGIACRFPRAHGPHEYWELLCQGIDAITEVPAERLNPGKSGDAGEASAWGGFIDNVDRFDAAFFGIAPRMASEMDPQQRLLLESAWECLEDAGILPASLAGSRTGVFVGAINRDYQDLLVSAGHTGAHSVLGNTPSGLAARISYALDLRGPSMCVDTACSAALSALNLARQSILTGESRLAIVGGVNLVLSPYPGAAYGGASLLAPDGQVKFGDATADGFVRSDGVGVVLLKPLPDALADGDPVRAVLLGTATNNDGADGRSFTTPTATGQREVMARACVQAGIEPADLDYLEAHGSGTAVGDPIEVNTALSFYGAGRRPDRPLLLGSAKTNMGHTESASGMAGLIKAVLCVQHRAVPPSLHLSTPNPQIDWAAAPAGICTELTAVPDRGRPMIAGVNALGMTGMNAHAVVSEYVPVTPSPGRADEAAGEAYLLALSARDPDSLRELATRYQRYLRDAGTTQARLAAVCRSAGERRTHHDHRLAVAGASREEVSDSLAGFLSGLATADTADAHDVPETPPRLAFVFSGQGSHWTGMGRELLASSPVFAARLGECDAAIGKEAGWSLLDKLADDSLDHAGPSVLQPALWAVEVSLAALWESWGITPSLVVGHSMGEVAAACAAGILTIEDGARVACRRGALVDRLRGGGGMAVAGLSEAEAEAEIARFSGSVAVGAVNAPGLTVLAGDLHALSTIGERQSRRGVVFQLVDIDYASHSPQVDPILDEMMSLLAEIRPSAGHTPLYSTVTGQLIDGRSLDAGYWCSNIREKVRLADVMQAIAADDLIVVEVGPHPVLLGALRQCQRVSGGGKAFGSLRRCEPERRALLSTAGHLYASGFPLRWAEVNGPCTEFVRPPLYPWRRDRFWVEDLAVGAASGDRVQDAGDGVGMEYELDLDVAGDGSYLGGHQVQGVGIVPGTVSVNIALAAGRRLRAGRDATIRDLRLHSPMVLDVGARRLRVTLSAGTGSGHSMELCSRTADGGDWVRQASAMLVIASQPRMTRVALGPIHERCAQQVDGGEFYRTQAALGNQWNDCFQGIRTVRRRDGEALAEVRAPAQVAAAMDEHDFHPALLDACCQALVAAMTPAQAANGAFVLEGIDEARVVQRPGPVLFSHAVADGSQDARSLRGDIRVYDPQGSPVAEILGLRLRYLMPATRPAPPADAQVPADDWVYELKWRPRQAPPRGPLASGRWLVLTDQTGVGADLARRLRETGRPVTLVVLGTRFGRLGPDCYQVAPGSAADFRRVLADGAGAPGSPGWASVVHLWSLNQPAEPPFPNTASPRPSMRAAGPRSGSCRHSMTPCSPLPRPSGSSRGDASRPRLVMRSSPCRRPYGALAGRSCRSTRSFPAS